MIDIYLISEEGKLLRNLPQLFHAEDFNVICIGGRSSFLIDEHDFIKIEKIGGETFIGAFLRHDSLLRSINGIVILGTDSEMREVSTSTIPLEIKLKLLPGKSLDSLKLYDSKIGLFEISQKAGANFPESRVIQTRDDLRSLLNTWNPPFLLKRDSGWGGDGIIKISPENMEAMESSDQLELPALAQEKLEGAEISVEAFFLNGRLRAYLYRRATGLIYPYGPSFASTYETPPAIDFLSVLQKIGLHGEITGFVNSSFIRNPVTGAHTLIEFDPRPNVWHFLAPRFGLNVSSFFSATSDVEIQSYEGPKIDFIMMERYAQYLATHFNLLQTIRELQRFRKNQVMVASFNGSVDTNSLVIITKIFWLVILRIIYRKIPEALQAGIKKTMSL